MSGRRAPLVVVAAVIERDGRYLLARRLRDTHLAGMWEFPGGKREQDETLEGCLERELVEELGVQATIGDEILCTEHRYPERTVRLHFMECRVSTEPRPLLGQELLWAGREELATLPFPDADRDLIDLLLLR